MAAPSPERLLTLRMPAAADAIAARVSESALNPGSRIPSAFDPPVATDVAAAVQETAAGT